MYSICGYRVNSENSICQRRLWLLKAKAESTRAFVCFLSQVARGRKPHLEGDEWTSGSLVVFCCQFKLPQEDESVAQVAAGPSLCRPVTKLLCYEQTLCRNKGKAQTVPLLLKSTWLWTTEASTQLCILSFTLKCMFRFEEYASL